jgi:glutamate 5-kinase
MPAATKAPALADFRRIVVKVGSSLLVDAKAGRLKETWLASLADDIARLHQEKRDIIVVSSGSIALGRSVLKLPKGPLKLEDSQAAAAVGQIALARTWAEVLGKHGITASQILVTLDDTEERRRYLNDRLAARVATMASADLLVLLSDIDGLYDAPPHLDKSAKHIPLVPRITAEIEAMAGDAASDHARGGMRTKIEAGKIATTAGTHMVIASGHVDNPLKAIGSAGSRATWFLAPGNPVTSRKRWIAGSLEPRGTLVIDAGAAAAIRSGKSLLPAGVIRVDGSFGRGDAVVIRGPDGAEIGRGLVAYDAEDAARIVRKSSSDIKIILGIEGRAEMVHRDDMVLAGA